MMKKLVVAFTLAALVAAGAANAGLGDVISSFPLTGIIMAHAVAWNGQYLAVTNYHYSGDRMWRHYTTTGSLVGSFDPPRGPYSPVQYGAEFDGTYYWGSDLFQQKYVYRFTTQGSTISSFPAPDPSGIAWDGSHLWIMSLYGGTVRQYTTEGSVVKSFNVAPINAGYRRAVPRLQLHDGRVRRRLVRFPRDLHDGLRLRRPLPLALGQQRLEARLPGGRRAYARRRARLRGQDKGAVPLAGAGASQLVRARADRRRAFPRRERVV
jgi:hypothetical protein